MIARCSTRWRAIVVDAIPEPSCSSRAARADGASPIDVPAGVLVDGADGAEGVGLAGAGPADHHRDRSPAEVETRIAAAWSSPERRRLRSRSSTATGSSTTDRRPARRRRVGRGAVARWRAATGTCSAVRRSSATVRPGAWTRRRSAQWSPTCDDGGGGERPIARSPRRRSIDVPAGSSAATAWVRSNRVNVPDLLRDALGQQPVEPLVEGHRPHQRRRLAGSPRPSRGSPTARGRRPASDRERRRGAARAALGPSRAARPGSASRLRASRSRRGRCLLVRVSSSASSRPLPDRSPAMSSHSAICSWRRENSRSTRVGMPAISAESLCIGPHSTPSRTRQLAAHRGLEHHPDGAP